MSVSHQPRRSHVRDLGPRLPGPPRPPAPRRPDPDPAPTPPDTCSIPVFRINGVPHHLCGIARQPGDEATRIYLVSTVAPAEGDRYHVCQHPWGCTCECPEFARGVEADACRHIKALARLGFVINLNAYTAVAAARAEKGGAR